MTSAISNTHPATGMVHHARHSQRSRWYLFLWLWQKLLHRTTACLWITRGKYHLVSKHKIYTIDRDSGSPHDQLHNIYRRQKIYRLRVLLDVIEDSSKAIDKFDPNYADPQADDGDSDLRLQPILSSLKPSALAQLKRYISSHPFSLKKIVLDIYQAVRPQSAKLDPAKKQHWFFFSRIRRTTDDLERLLSGLDQRITPANSLSTRIYSLGSLLAYLTDRQGCSLIFSLASDNTFFRLSACYQGQLIHSITQAIPATEGGDQKIRPDLELIQSHCQKLQYHLDKHRLKASAFYWLENQAVAIDASEISQWTGLPAYQLRIQATAAYSAGLENTTKAYLYDLTESLERGQAKLEYLTTRAFVNRDRKNLISKFCRVITCALLLCATFLRRTSQQTRLCPD